MSVATIQFLYKGDDEEADDMVTSIWPILCDEQGIALDNPVMKNQPISFAGSSSQSYGSSVQVPAPGEYLVDVRLANGRRIRRTILVDDQKAYPFSIRSETISTSSTIASPPPTPRTGGEEMVGASATSALKVVIINEPVCSVHLTGFALLIDITRAMRGNDSTMVVLAEAADAMGGKRLKIDRQETTHNRVNFENYSRRWVGVFGQGLLETITPLPAPWRSLDDTAVMELVVHRNDGNADYKDSRTPIWHPHLKIGDSQWDAMIEFLTRRDIGASHALMHTALEALAEKIHNPFAAAAGAYVFALNPDEAYSEEKANWPEWINNLSIYFPWLPDAKIAQGWIHLRAGERGRQSWVEARASFLEAVQRGVPYFSTGLRLLSDGLTTLTMTEGHDAEVEVALKAVRTAQLAMDPHAVFTKLRVLDWPGVNDPIKATDSYSGSVFDGLGAPNPSPTA